MSRLVIISNRLPVTIDKVEKGEMIYHPSAGGLATGLNSLETSREKLWIGWPGREITDPWEQEAVKASLKKDNLVPVFLSEDEIELYYRGFSNKTVWPHFHYFTQYTNYNDEYWTAYKEVNQKFMEAARQVIQPTDLVWVHDYQLMLLPAMIREAFPELSMGFFLHIPFPSYEVFRILPWRESILTGILGADLIGFHTFGYMRHFLSAVYRIGGYEHYFGKLTVGKRLVNVDMFPMGIDYEKYAFPEKNPDTVKSYPQIEQLAANTRLVISIDRLDYTKGIPARIEAFREFLDRNPGYLEKVTLVMIVVPSRSNVDQYQELKHDIDTLVGEVNSAFSTFDWVPIRYFYRSLDFGELTALYQAAEVALITPLRDGMNLVAKEFVASKEADPRGVLILSEMAGAADELTEALLINPQDMADMVGALEKALSMPEAEQEAALRSMQNKLKKNNVKIWANAFIQEQRKLMEQKKQENSIRLGKQERQALYQEYGKAEARLLMLDYDGTLMGFQPDPKAVVPDQELMSLLENVIKVPGNHLVVNSGRDKETLQAWLGHLPIDMAAEHGVWTRIDGHWAKNPGLSIDWKDDIRAVLEDMVERTPGSFIEEKEFSIAWHYRRIDRDLGQKRVREFRDVLLYLTANLDLQVLEGHKVVEIKNAGVNKGKSALNWINRQPWDFMMAVGDDHTDEDTFKAMPREAFTIKVGLGNSWARYSLLSVEDVRGVLRELIAVRDF